MEMHDVAWVYPPRHFWIFFVFFGETLLLRSEIHPRYSLNYPESYEFTTSSHDNECRRDTGYHWTRREAKG